MSTTSSVLTGARQEIRAIRRPQPLLGVLRWELRRFRASRLFWVQALGFFCLTLFVTWLGRAPEGFSVGNGQTVTRDLQRRTHELLMTTALPTRAYVWGRYLMGLLISLSLAILMLLAILGMG